MDTRNGTIYELGEDLDLGAFRESVRQAKRVQQQEKVAALRQDLGRRLTADEMAAVKATVKGADIVRVSEEVAQQQRAGQRELGRRKRRRQAAKQARKRTRT